MAEIGLKDRGPLSSVQSAIPNPKSQRLDIDVPRLDAGQRLDVDGQVRVAGALVDGAGRRHHEEEEAVVVVVVA